MRTLKIHGPWAVSLITAAALSWSGTAFAQKINCANEFRSGKLYFSQNIYDKAVNRLAVAVEVCPEKSEYRARYAIALAQLAAERLVYVPTLADTAARNALIDSLEAMVTLAGDEFDSSLAQEDCNKKIQKLVRESREHFWVDRYNQGIKLNEEENFSLAELNFRLSRLLNDTDPRAYSQAAIALIKMGDKAKAAELVQKGLEKVPDDEKLSSLQVSIYLDAANDLTREAEEEKSLEKADKALWYLEQVQAKSEETDPDILFKSGLAEMAAAGAITEAKSGDGESTEGVARYLAAAESFARAGELVPFTPDPATEEAAGNNDFHMACRFNQIQSLWYAEDCEATIEAIKEYVQLRFDEAAIWQIWTFCLRTQGDSDQAASAIMVSKSLGGTEISVDDAMKNAKADAAAALKELGPPDKVVSYQTEDGYQVDTWFWVANRKAMSFVLGVKNGEMAW